MGKTKTAFVAGSEEEKLTGAEKYKLKQKQKEEQAAKGQDNSQSADKESSIVEESKAGMSPKARRGVRVRSKKYLAARAKVTKDKEYSLNEAVTLVKETSYAKFKGSVEFHATVKKSDLNIQASLPNSAGKEKVIEVADDKTLAKLKSGKIDFDILLATADMMPKLVPFAKVLGPKGLMPNPRNGTLIKDKKDVKKFGGNSITIKCEKKAPLVHLPVGKVDQKESEIMENIEAVIKAIGSKQIEKAHLASSMGPSVKLKIN